MFAREFEENFSPQEIKKYDDLRFNPASTAYVTDVISLLEPEPYVYAGGSIRQALTNAKICSKCGNLFAETKNNFLNPYESISILDRYVYTENLNENANLCTMCKKNNY